MSVGSAPATFWRSHLLYPLAAFSLLAALFESYPLDFMLADTLFEWQDNRWLFREHWLLEDLLHTGARQLMIATALLLIVIWTASLFLRAMQNLRSRLGYLLLSALLSATCISLLKQITGIDCPWSLSRYGGDQGFVSLLMARPDSYPAAKCFPAGHASAGYSWLGVYYLLRSYRPAWKWAGLALVLTAGLVFGVTQQIRGAHFISHDLWTLAICWLNATVLYGTFFYKRT